MQRIINRFQKEQKSKQLKSDHVVGDEVSDDNNTGRILYPINVTRSPPNANDPNVEVNAILDVTTVDNFITKDGIRKIQDPGLKLRIRHIPRALQHNYQNVGSGEKFVINEYIELQITASEINPRPSQVRFLLLPTCFGAFHSPSEDVVDETIDVVIGSRFINRGNNAVDMVHNATGPRSTAVTFTPMEVKANLTTDRKLRDIVRPEEQENIHRQETDPIVTVTVAAPDSGYSSLVSKTSLKTEGDDLDTQSITSLKSDNTSISSLDPAGVGGVAEEFAEILWGNEEIQHYVNQGFMSREREQFEQSFIRLLHTYASDLPAEAKTETQKRAARVVHSFRAYVARIIRKRVVGLNDDTQATAFHGIRDQTTTKLMLERFLAQPHLTAVLDQSDTRLEVEQESDGDSYSGDEEPYLPNLEKLTNFLTSSSAFKNLNARLESLVKLHSELPQIVANDLSSPIVVSDKQDSTKQQYPGFLKRIQNTLRSSLRPPIAPGSHRIEWICDCGVSLYMDFNDNAVRSSLTVNSLLCFASATLHPSGSSHAPGQSPPTTSIPLQTQLGENNSRNLAGQLRQVNKSQNLRISLGASTTTSATQSTLKSTFLELCVNTGPLLKTLGEIDVSAVKTDGEFFHIVKAHYLRLRDFRTRFWFLKPTSVSYVRFSVEDHTRVGILQKPMALPPKPEVDAKRYIYSPCPPDHEPPISNELFLHYSFSCICSSPNLVWVPRIPRKLDISILASQNPTSFGWGVHIDEGPDIFRIAWLNFVFFGLSIVTGVSWAIARSDLLGAIGLAIWFCMSSNVLVAFFIMKWKHE